ncbi:MAG: tyrosinase family protein [Pseudomonadota bacterium]
MAIRQSIRGLERQRQNIELLRAAMARLQGLPDDRGFDFFAALHGLALPFWCEHGTQLFLPWHRAYLYYFELALQSRLAPGFVERPPEEPGFAEVGLPWWDWSAAQSHADGIPESYAADVVGGVPNPLAGSAIGTGVSPLFTGVWSSALLQAVRAQIPGAITADDPPRTLRDPDDADELPQPGTVSDIVLQQNTFTTFTTSLEQVHDDVHVWVGGSMSSVPTSAYDPIFWSHHCMIDRLWYIWQLSALGADPPPALLDRVLAPFPMTVRQTLDIETLGYDYAVELVA